ncbi:hypothetical protein C1752_03815 [Acaryochloris thomasi RCC1774]|uniref:Uncharacterized protein n=1 Tax=Acaryochloris thomasi RCC1774 TaxID=1764569 RepID=A0A2W1JF32_9CYAN|nr:hypothetical protein [Acaryochloris thomasi]PZD72228.1 hypothetical protein C1752_03815 [Acaryochloris thomasi RCC1774]
MKLLGRFLGLVLVLLGLYVLGQNIYFTTNVSPYWWRGLAADSSVLCLTSGIISLFFFPKELKSLGWIAMGLGVLLVFVSSRAVLQPTSLWQFCLSTASFVGGYQLITKGKINL